MRHTALKWTPAPLRVLAAPPVASVLDHRAALDMQPACGDVHADGLRRRMREAAGRRHGGVRSYRRPCGLTVTASRGMAAALLLLCGAGHASAELKYTLHVELKKLGPTAGRPVNPLVAMMGDNMIKELLPGGSADLTYVIGEKGTRVEYAQAAMGQPAGTVALSLANGTMVGLNITNQTYWRMDTAGAADAMKAAGVSPDVTLTRTGQFLTTAGVRCERVMFDMNVDLPIPDAIRASLPPDFPRALALAGETCLASEPYQKYAQMAANRRVRDFLSELDMDKVIQGTLPMRHTLTFGSIQLDQVITAIAEEEVPGSMFEIPAGYKEIPAPPRGR